ncbi:MAG: mandelate racemase [Rhizobiales bacterium 65-79]|nr:MAG: mandelate racemase [Rhizobiales bacterium 65-79]
MSAPAVKVVGVSAYERPTKMRMPFRFGVTTATHARQAIVEARIRLADGREGSGYAAEALGAKWFDKNLALTDAQNHHQLRKSLEMATATYCAASPSTAFGLFADGYEHQMAICEKLGLNPLIASYGPALLDRAVLDALCRLEGVSFYAAMRANLAGIAPHRIAPELAGFDFGRFLCGLSPASAIDVRHTVGLVDPITRADQKERIGDGLPETLEEVISAYGNNYFKLKVGGDAEADIERLEKIAAVLDQRSEPYFVTLDGNEQYDDAESTAAFLEHARARPKLSRLFASTLYIEQPIRRSAAMARPVGALAAFAPVIIDESDGELSSFPRARELGYAGVSSKNCKGFYKSILNRARCAVWNNETPGRYFMSAEDLTTEPGLSVQQDLALVNLLGLTHVERNAHHFIDGFGGRPEAEARAHLAAHPDLYAERGGRVRMKIEDGRLAIGSLDCAGFASAVPPFLEAAEPMPKSGWEVLYDRGL